MQNQALSLVSQCPYGLQCLIPFVKVLPIAGGAKFDEWALNVFQNPLRMT